MHKAIAYTLNNMRC